jgi:hypothetical protein
MSISKVAHATQTFRSSLEEAWSGYRSQEQELVQACAPALEEVKLLLQSLASTVSEVTGEPATVGETASAFHVESHDLVVLHCIQHSSGTFHIRLRFKADRVEYNRERIKLAEVSILLDFIVRDALNHFSPRHVKSKASAA